MTIAPSPVQASFDELASSRGFVAADGVQLHYVESGGGSSLLFVPGWMATVIVLREIAVTGLRAIASQSGLVVPAQELGKYKMIFQIFALTGLLLHYTYPIPFTSAVVDFHAAGMRFLWIALVVSVWSAVDYYVRVLRQIRLD